jgi:hypothetical protein
MDRFQQVWFGTLRLTVIGILAACVGCRDASQHTQPEGTSQSAAAAQAQANLPLSADDVSWLFPAPTRAEDFARLIAVGDLTTQNTQEPAKRDPVWPDAAFQQFLAIAASPAAQVAGTQAQIGLPSEAQSIKAWFIAGIRIDAGAPGLSNDIRAQFGQLPQIRLIVQPVIRNADGTPKVLDIAGHLIFNFTLAKPNDPPQGDCLPRLIPDLDASHAIVTDLAAIRTKLSNGELGTNKVTTSGAPLGVHPGLADPTTAGEAYFRFALGRHGDRGTSLGGTRTLDLRLDTRYPSRCHTRLAEWWIRSRPRSHTRWPAIRSDACTCRNNSTRCSGARHK